VSEINKENAGQTQPHLQSFFSGSDRPARGVLYQNRYLNPFQTRFGTINFPAMLFFTGLIDTKEYRPTSWLQDQPLLAKPTWKC
jgi:hypothetical protein